jgi:hypothetical protein
MEMEVEVEEAHMEECVETAMEADLEIVREIVMVCQRPIMGVEEEAVCMVLHI